MRWVLGLLDGDVWLMTKPRVPGLKAGVKFNVYTTGDEMLTDLDDRYSEINSSSKAMTELTKLYQADGEIFSKFYGKFLRYRSRIEFMNDPTEMHMLKERLNYRYGNKITDGTEYPTY